MKTSLRVAMAAAMVAAFVWVAGCETMDRWGVSVGGGKSPEEQQTKSPEPGPPDHAPAWGRRAQHRYRYYPDRRVYYDTDRGLWFYASGDGWKVSAGLPAGTSVAGLDYVEISMESDTPYTENAEHQKKYPPGQDKKKDKKDKGKKKDK